MKNRIYYLAFICLLLFSTGVWAQGKMDKNRIDLLKISFLTEEIDLTSEEAQQFWPIYNKYNDRIHEARVQLERGTQREIKSSGGVKNLSEEQSADILERIMKLEETISSNKITMTKELRSVISDNKIIRLQIAEREFNRRMLQEYGKRKRMNR